MAPIEGAPTRPEVRRNPELRDWSYYVIPNGMEELRISGRRVIIKLSFEPDSSVLKHECVNKDHLVATNPQGNGHGPCYVTPADIAEIVEELGLQRVDINWGPASEDMVFLCGWREAFQAAYEHYFGRDPTTTVTPDITAELATFLKKFRYIVFPKEEFSLVGCAWLDPDGIQYAGDNLSSVFISESFTDSPQDRRKYLILHAQWETYARPEAYANDNDIELIRPVDMSAFNHGWVATAAMQDAWRYGSSVVVYPNGPDQPSELRWLRRLRLARDVRDARDARRTVSFAESQ